MNKTEFLTLLRNGIHMLEDEEQNDIVNEYSQHIDMKMQKGMTEAQAIDDFGSPDLLIEEVLAAYHVKAPESAGASSRSSASGDPTSSDRSAASALLEGGKQVASATVEATKKGYERVRNAASETLRKSRGPAATGDSIMQGAVADSDDGRKAHGAKCGRAEGSSTGSLMSNCARGARSIWLRCWNALRTAARWCWNLFVACIGAGVALLTIAAVFAFGFCLLLCFQGYPLGGVSIALFGCLVAGVSLTGICMRLIVMKKQRRVDSQSDNDFLDRSPSNCEVAQ